MENSTKHLHPVIPLALFSAPCTYVHTYLRTYVRTTPSRDRSVGSSYHSASYYSLIDIGLLFDLSSVFLLVDILVDAEAVQGV